MGIKNIYMRIAGFDIVPDKAPVSMTRRDEDGRDC
jgi:hypothetical protein